MDTNGKPMLVKKLVIKQFDTSCPVSYRLPESTKQCTDRIPSFKQQSHLLPDNYENSQNNDSNHSSLYKFYPAPPITAKNITTGVSIADFFIRKNGRDEVIDLKSGEVNKKRMRELRE